MLTRQGRVLSTQVCLTMGHHLKEIGLPSVLLSEAGVPGFIEEEHPRRHVQVVTGYAQTRGFGEFAGLGWSVWCEWIGRTSWRLFTRSCGKLGSLAEWSGFPMLGLLFWATARLRAEYQQAQQESAWAKAAEAALLQSQERNRAIVDTALTG